MADQKITCADRNEESERCKIWAIGGGKGGTGKSFVTSNMGAYLAKKGKDVVLIDADLGGANLHSFLGLNKSKSSLDDFFKRGVPLADLIDNFSSGCGNIGLVKGDIHSLESDKVRYTQKLKLFRHIRKLESDHVLIDLGAGSHFTAIDTFLLADKMLVVIVPEVTSVENMYQFVKSVVFRKLNMAFSQMGLKPTFQKTWNERSIYGLKSLRDLLDYLRKISIDVKDVVDDELNDLEINIIINQFSERRRYDPWKFRKKCFDEISGRQL